MRYYSFFIAFLIYGSLKYIFSLIDFVDYYLGNDIRVYPNGYNTNYYLDTSQGS